MRLSFLSGRISVAAFVFASLLIPASCEEDRRPDEDEDGSFAVLLVIDEDSIDNDTPPNYFSESDVNDQSAAAGLRINLRYFQDNIGERIDLYTGQVGDEGWFALKTIPDSWKSAGPTEKGSLNFLTPGPGLGAPVPDGHREVLLDEVPDVTPLRATGLSMLKGQTVVAVIYDSDISIDYAPLKGNLQGANLGLVTFKVIDVKKRTEGSSSSLPAVTIRILDADITSGLPLVLFSNAPVPQSSSEPMDIKPPSSPAAPQFVAAP